MQFLRRFATVTILFVIAGPAFGTGTLRCATHVVDQGMTKEEVIQVCGQPAARQEDDTYWYYDRGSSLLVVRLFFVNDRVQFIEDVPKDEM